MIDGLQRGRTPAGTQRSPRRVEPSGSARETGSETPRTPGRALVAVEPPRPNPASQARAAAFAPYLTQLIVCNIGDGPSGERRSDRRPELVAGRADRLYKTADRLGSDIEAGFLYRRIA